MSDEVVTTTKTGRRRRLTGSSATADLWHDTLTIWQQRIHPARPLGDWLFSSDADHCQRLRAGTLSHWFRSSVREHGHDEVRLHALRHTVATVLVADGQVLQAQQRLGHAEASTTLRQYCHALPVHDRDVADRLGILLDEGK